MISVFRRVGRYTPSLHLDPRENRLTESFAAVLERVDGLAAHLIFDWCGIAAPSEIVWVRTQRSTAGGNFVDLEVGFGSEVGPELRVWIEIKHGADLHDSQLANYRNDLAVEVQADAQLVVLAPRGGVDGAEADRSVAWQDVAPALKQFASGHELNPVNRWLLDEFTLYLKEEALTDEEAMTPAHAFELAARPSSDRVVERLLELTQTSVARELGQPKAFLKKSGSKPTYAVGFWASYPPSDDSDELARWGDAWLEWTCRTDEFRADSHDGIGFFVGATFQKMQGSALSKQENAQWAAGIQAAGFERVQAWYWRLWRPLYPEQLMSEPTLAGQAKVLSEWVVDAIRELRASPPPAR